MENINPNVNASLSSFNISFNYAPDCEFYFPNYLKSELAGSNEYDPAELGTSLKLNRSALAWAAPGFSALFYDGVENGSEIEQNPIYIIEDVDLKTFKKLLK